MQESYFTHYSMWRAMLWASLTQQSRDASTGTRTTIWGGSEDSDPASELRWHTKIWVSLTPAAAGERFYKRRKCDCGDSGSIASAPGINVARHALGVTNTATEGCFYRKKNYNLGGLRGQCSCSEDRANPARCAPGVTTAAAHICV